MRQTSTWCDQVFAQLERILQSKQFKNSKRLKKFLTYVVEKTLLCNPDIIRSYNIAVEVFGKGSSFDPGDPYVRNIAGNARRGLDKYYATAGVDDKIRIDVPAGNYIATFASREDDSLTLPANSSRLADFDVLPTPNYSVSSVASGLRQEGVEVSRPSIAVIPFNYQGADSDHEMVIGEILASGLISGLSKSSQLNVISWLSTTQFRNNQSDILGVSRSLSCDYLISGSYVCRGDRLSVFIEIADCVSQEVIWADTMQSTVGKLLSADAELLAGLTVDSAKVVLGREIHKAFNVPLKSLSLNTKLLGGMLDMHSENDQQFYRVKTQFDQILKHYPNHTTVNALLAQWHVLKINRGGGWQVIDDERIGSVAQACLDTALEANPNHPFALTMQGLVETQFNRNPEKGLSLYDTAEQYNPNEPVLMACKAATLSYKGHAKAAVRFAKKAIALSPFDPQLSLFHTCAAGAYYVSGDCDSAKYHADCAYSLNPAHTSNLRTLVAIQIDLGDVIQARTSARELMAIDPGFTTGSYLKQSPSAGYKTGQQIADRLEQAGIPAV